MDAVKFLKEKNRMCKKVNNCFSCPLGNEEGGCQVGSRVNQRVTEEQLVENVKKWAEEHPVKTRQSEFLKMFPNAKMLNGVISVNPCEVDTENCGVDSESEWCQKCDSCESCHKDYWLAEVE